MTDIETRVSEMTDIQRRWAEAEHEWSCADDPDPHPVEAHEPFDVTPGDEPWDEFMARLARHGLRLSLADVKPPREHVTPTEAQGELTMSNAITEPKVQPVYVGVSRPVSLRATVLSDGNVLWSADALDSAGNGYVGTGATPEEATRSLSQTLAFHAESVN